MSCNVEVDNNEKILKRSKRKEKVERQEIYLYIFSVLRNIL